MIVVGTAVHPITCPDGKHGPCPDGFPAHWLYKVTRPTNKHLPTRQAHFMAACPLSWETGRDLSIGQQLSPVVMGHTWDPYINSNTFSHAQQLSKRNSSISLFLPAQKWQEVTQNHSWNTNISRCVFDITGPGRKWCVWYFPPGRNYYMDFTWIKRVFTIVSHFYKQTSKSVNLSWLWCFFW